MAELSKNQSGGLDAGDGTALVLRSRELSCLPRIVAGRAVHPGIPIQKPGLTYIGSALRMRSRAQ